eukprot:CFRG6844T1
MSSKTTHSAVADVTAPLKRGLTLGVRKSITATGEAIKTSHNSSLAKSLLLDYAKDFGGTADIIIGSTSSHIESLGNKLKDMRKSVDHIEQASREIPMLLLFFDDIDRISRQSLKGYFVDNDEQESLAETTVKTESDTNASEMPMIVNSSYGVVQPHTQTTECTSTPASTPTTTPVTTHSPISTTSSTGGFSTVPIIGLLKLPPWKWRRGTNSSTVSSEESSSTEKVVDIGVESKLGNISVKTDVAGKSLDSRGRNSDTKAENIVDPVADITEPKNVEQAVSLRNLHVDIASVKTDTTNTDEDHGAGEDVGKDILDVSSSLNTVNCVNSAHKMHADKCTSELDGLVLERLKSEESTDIFKAGYIKDVCVNMLSEEKDTTNTGVEGREGKGMTGLTYKDSTGEKAVIVRKAGIGTDVGLHASPCTDAPCEIKTTSSGLVETDTIGTQVEDMHFAEKDSCPVKKWMTDMDNDSNVEKEIDASANTDSSINVVAQDMTSRFSGTHVNDIDIHDKEKDVFANRKCNITNDQNDVAISQEDTGTGGTDVGARADESRVVDFPVSETALATETKKDSKQPESVGHSNKKRRKRKSKK